jgi:nitroimidazol reductase NimA-like FMN-containing flavoprotein (pyridoxamine 5'-phosphate oxidase superfamily)
MTDASSFDVTKENRVRQIKRKAAYDEATVHSILDAGHVAQVGFVQDGAPVVIPMLYGRQGNQLFLHGARKARIIRLLEQSPRACVSVTLLDGVVIARSMFNCSMNYRSVNVFGEPYLVDDHNEKLAAMRVIAEHLLPGRWDEARDSHDREVKMTGVLALPIDSASAKVSEGAPNDEEDDYALPIWAGVLPLSLRTGSLRTDEAGVRGLEPSEAIKSLQNRDL